MQKYPALVYFCIATLTQLLAQSSPPATWWDTFRWFGSAILAGLITAKAKQSPSDQLQK